MGFYAEYMYRYKPKGAYEEFLREEVRDAFYRMYLRGITGFGGGAPTEKEKALDRYVAAINRGFGEAFVKALGGHIGEGLGIGLIDIGG